MLYSLRSAKERQSITNMDALGKGMLPSYSVVLHKNSVLKKKHNLKLGHLFIKKQKQDILILFFLLNKQIYFKVYYKIY